MIQQWSIDLERHVLNFTLSRTFTSGTPAINCSVFQLLYYATPLGAGLTPSSATSQYRLAGNAAFFTSVNGQCPLDSSAYILAQMNMTQLALYADNRPVTTGSTFLTDICYQFRPPQTVAPAVLPQLESAVLSSDDLRLQLSLSEALRPTFFFTQLTPTNGSLVDVSVSAASGKAQVNCSSPAIFRTDAFLSLSVAALSFFDIYGNGNAGVSKADVSWQSTGMFTIAPYDH